MARIELALSVCKTDVLTITLHEHTCDKNRTCKFGLWGQRVNRYTTQEYFNKKLILL